MAYITDVFAKRWAVTSEFAADDAVSEIGTGLLQVGYLLDLIANQHDDRSEASERVDSLANAAIALLVQLGSSVDALESYVSETGRIFRETADAAAEIRSRQAQPAAAG